MIPAPGNTRIWLAAGVTDMASEQARMVHVRRKFVDVFERD
ncbi:hypothetical protein [Paracoccus ravus]|nr:hypothetical protein [Paracoccus ravus]